MFDSSMVNEPSGFEPLKFYCMSSLTSNVTVNHDYAKYKFVILLIEYKNDNCLTDVYMHH